MGRTITQLVTASNDLELTSACDHPKSGALGQDCGEVAGIGKLNVPIVDGVSDTVQCCDILVDFSHADSSLEATDACKEQNRGLVIGTTGFSDEQLDVVQSAAGDIPILMSPNMSIGVNITFKLVENGDQSVG